MKHQSGEGEKPKKRLDSAETGSKERQPAPEADVNDDIDPADFIDPEEFGIRRKFESFRP
jgi:hypothetical protein